MPKVTFYFQFCGKQFFISQISLSNWWCYSAHWNIDTTQKSLNNKRNIFTFEVSTDVAGLRDLMISSERIFLLSYPCPPNIACFHPCNRNSTSNDFRSLLGYWLSSWSPSLTQKCIREEPNWPQSWCWPQACWASIAECRVIQRHGWLSWDTWSISCPITLPGLWGQGTNSPQSRLRGC